MPVTTPGRAMGSTKSSDMVSRPRMRERASAPAARVPSTSAAAVEAAATCSESERAARMSSRPAASGNHFSV